MLPAYKNHDDQPALEKQLLENSRWLAQTKQVVMHGPAEVSSSFIITLQGYTKDDWVKKHKGVAPDDLGVTPVAELCPVHGLVDIFWKFRDSSCMGDTAYERHITVQDRQEHVLPVVAAMKPNATIAAEVQSIVATRSALSPPAAERRLPDVPLFSPTSGLRLQRLLQTQRQTQT